MADDPSRVAASSGGAEAPGSEAWTDLFARNLEEAPLSPRELGQVLKLARDVAHGVERKLAPLAAYLAGIHVGRRVVEGRRREEALTEAVQAAERLLASQTNGEGEGGASSPER